MSAQMKATWTLVVVTLMMVLMVYIAFKVTVIEEEADLRYEEMKPKPEMS